VFGAEGVARGERPAAPAREERSSRESIPSYREAELLFANGAEGTAPFEPARGRQRLLGRLYFRNSHLEPRYLHPAPDLGFSDGSISIPPGMTEMSGHFISIQPTFPDFLTKSFRSDQTIRECPDDSFRSDQTIRQCPDDSFQSDQTIRECSDDSFRSDQTIRECPDDSFRSDQTLRECPTVSFRFDET